MRPRNHKELIAELRAFNKYLVSTKLLGKLLEAQAELALCPDTQFYFPQIEHNIKHAREVIQSTVDFLISARDLVRLAETEENTKSEMNRIKED